MKRSGNHFNPFKKNHGLDSDEERVIFKELISLDPFDFD